METRDATRFTASFFLHTCSLDAAAMLTEGTRQTRLAGLERDRTFVAAVSRVVRVAETPGGKVRN